MFSKLLVYVRQHHLGMLALFIALSGTAYAATLPRNSVGPRQIKKNAVNSAKVKNASLLARDFRRGQLPSGPTGPQGPAGPRGPQGAAGANGSDGSDGANGATNVVVRSSSGTIPGTGTFDADCLPGERATGGGTENPGIADRPKPPTPGATPTGWQAVNQTGSPSSIVVWVVCASP